jgi:competence ComEA-like helix-hairpin-helix protein
MNRKSHFTTIRILLVFGLLIGALAVQNAEAAKIKKLDLNTATQAELEGLQGVSAAMAEKIIAARPFKSVEDLMNVKGLGQTKFDNIKKLVMVGTVKAVETAATQPKTKAKTLTTVKETEPAADVKLLNLNTAGKADLENLEGVGPALAEKIIAARPFKSVEELKNVKGFGEAKFNKIKNLVTVETLKAKSVRTTETKAKAKSKTVESELVDINTADKAALEGLVGVGPALAEKIIAARPFKRVEDLKNVKGIGEAKFNAIKDLVSVGEEEETVTAKLKPGQTININSATQNQLESLLGVGPVKAEAIIAGRPYAKIEEIMKVKGIKEKTFAKIRDYIKVK